MVEFSPALCCAAAIVPKSGADAAPPLLRRNSRRRVRATLRPRNSTHSAPRPAPREFRTVKCAPAAPGKFAW